jgi:hypothetical protein
VIVRHLCEWNRFSGFERWRACSHSMKWVVRRPILPKNSVLSLRNVLQIQAVGVNYEKPKGHEQNIKRNLIVN